MSSVLVARFISLHKWSLPPALLKRYSPKIQAAEVEDRLSSQSELIPALPRRYPWSWGGEAQQVALWPSVFPLPLLFTSLCCLAVHNAALPASFFLQHAHIFRVHFPPHPLSADSHGICVPMAIFTKFCIRRIACTWLDASAKHSGTWRCSIPN